MNRKIVMLVMAVLCAVTVSGCAPDANAAMVSTGPGFWTGLWHGWISPITFLISLFSDSVGVYAIHNNGGWYNFGFLIGAGAFATGCNRTHR